MSSSLGPNSGGGLSQMAPQGGNSSSSSPSVPVMANNPLGSGSNSSQGIEELLPLVIQLTNPEQVRRVL